MYMISALKMCSDHVSWQFHEMEIDLIIEDVFFITNNKELNLVRIESGEKFIANKVYYYTYEGEMKFFYDLKEGEIKINNQENNIQLTVKHLKQVGYFPNEQRIMILCGDQKQEIHGYTTDGMQVFCKCILENMKALYFTKIDGNIAVVCDCDEKSADEYGRVRYNYMIDSNNGELVRYGLAY